MVLYFLHKTIAKCQNKKGFHIFPTDIEKSFQTVSTEMSEYEYDKSLESVRKPCVTGIGYTVSESEIV